MCGKKNICQVDEQVKYIYIIEEILAKESQLR